MRAPLVLAGCALAAAASFTVAVPAAAGQTTEGVPRYDHVAVLVLENETESSTWGPTSPAVYLNSLKAQGAFVTNYYADGHVSLDNYITMTSGQGSNGLTDTDCMTVNLYTCSQSVSANPVYGNGVNIGDQVEGAGLTWKEYADGLPSPCFHGSLDPTATPPDPYQGDSTSPPAYNYADRHDPFVYYTDITGNATRCAADDVPYTQLASDMSSNALPNYFFITPDTCHDGHDNPCAGAATGGLTSADAWLVHNLPSLLTYMNSHNGLLLITTDEAGTTDDSGCCTGGPGGAMGFGGKVGLLALGPGVAAGTTDSADTGDHASLLRLTEDALGITTHLNNAATAPLLDGIFAAPGASLPELPVSPAAALLTVAAAAVLARRHLRAR